MSRSAPHEIVAELQDISVAYGSAAARIEAVKNVSLTVRRSEVLLLMGPSGSGKSSLLQVLGGMRRPTSGRHMMAGQAIHVLSERDRCRLRCERIGFIFQHYNLLPSLRAWENVALALELRALSGSNLETQSRAMLRRLNLSHRADAFPEELSGGERQRVAIARAVVGGPDMILADEPTAALDAKGGAQVTELLARIAHTENRAVVIVTHDPRITAIADQIVHLEDGFVFSTGAPLAARSQNLQECVIHEMEDCSRGGADSPRSGRVSLAR